MMELFLKLIIDHMTTGDHMKSLVDGEDLGNGTVFSSKGGYSVCVYRCQCGREQTATHPLFSGGINPETAKKFGWVGTDTGWLCPFCGGQEDKLNSVFDKAD